MTAREQVRDAIFAARRRWQLRIVLHGLAVSLVTAILAVWLAGWAIDQFRYAPAVVVMVRLAAYLLVLGVAVRYLVWPLRRVPRGAQVALYLEEHEPTLGTYVASAVDFAEGRPADHSRALAEEVVRAAAERLNAVDRGRRVERQGLARSSGALAGAAVAGALVLLLSPSLWRGASTLLPWRGAAESNPYSIDVSPRDTVVARGSDLKVAARLVGFSTDAVELVVKRVSEGEWARWPMTPDDQSGDFAAVVFDLADAAEYFVEADGVRSPLVRVTVADLPYVRDISLEYRFPAYTGLRAQRVEGTGDVAALRGTVVQVEVTPTIAVTRAALTLEGGDTVALTATASGALTGRFTVRRPGSYRVVFDAAGVGQVVGSPDYLIDVLEDQPPSVRFSTPGRDLNVTSIEEVFTEVEAQDDFGIDLVEMVYAVNGGEERSVSLLEGGTRREVNAGHTLFLEEFGLEAGDVVSYYARAREAAPAGKTTTSDLYFLRIRRFDHAYRQADQQPGGGGGGGAEMNSALSERQREIVAGTFNVVRDRERYDEAELRENLTTLTLAEGRLREDVEELVGRMRERGIVATDSAFKPVAEALDLGLVALREAEELLGQHDPKAALAPEQRALQQLQRAEAVFRDIQVARGGQQGGGGGGGSPNAEDLADLFDLELDRLRNQYERLERGRREETSQQLDEILEKLRQLAQRQQQENERLRAWADRTGASGAAGTSGNQRRMAEEAEEMARRLERLAREQSRPELQESARQLRDAAEAMRRAAAAGASDGSAQGRSALDQLREARRQLEGGRSGDFRNAVDDALRRAERLATEQEEMEAGVDRVQDQATRDPEQVRRLQERKAGMASEVESLEGELDRLSREGRREQADASRQLAEAAGFIRDAKVREKLLFSRGVIQGRSPEYARNFEDQIASDLEELRDRVRAARDAVGESREQRVARALDQARDLANGMESLSDRLRSRQGQEGQEGQGQQGQQGQSGAQGQRTPGIGAPGGGGQGRSDPRQLGRDLRERTGDARQLRDFLSRERVDVAELDRIIARLRELDNRLNYGDPRASAMLAGELAQGIKEFEYAVRRQLEGAQEPRLFLSGSDDVPPRYRKLVEEYFRTLSERNQR